MTTRRMLLAVLAGCVCTGLALAAPEPPPKETKGQITGKLIKKDGGKITVQGEKGELTLIPFWRGGMPKDGGGFDKDMMKRLELFKVGDVVRVDWVFEEHYRIVKIEWVEKDGPPRDKKPEPRTTRE